MTRELTALRRFISLLGSSDVENFCKTIHRPSGTIQHQNQDVPNPSILFQLWVSPTWRLLHGTWCICTPVFSAPGFWLMLLAMLFIHSTSRCITRPSMNLLLSCPRSMTMIGLRWSTWWKSTCALFWESAISLWLMLIVLPLSFLWERTPPLDMLPSRMRWWARCMSIETVAVWNDGVWSHVLD